MEIIRRHFSRLDSTNAWGKHHLQELDRDAITLVTADEQTAGRGRFQREWISPPGQNIYASFCFFIEKPKEALNLAQLLSLSAAKMLQSFGFDPKLKWPNDILLNDKKVAGILCEMIDSGIILGIGLNVNMEKEALDTIDQPATSLALEKGEEVDVEAVLNLLSDTFMKDLKLFKNQGFSPFLEDYKYLVKPECKEGTFEGINPDGSLRVRLPSGKIKDLY